MELAFSALLLFILVLPGIIFRYSYSKGFGKWPIPSPTRSLSDQIAYSLVSAGLLHLLWSWFVYTLGQKIDLSAVVMMIMGSYGKDEEYLLPAIQSFTHYPYKIAVYFLSLYLASALLGFCLHSLVRNRKLDLKHRFLRFDNDWYYLLTGEILEFGETEGLDTPPDGVYLSAVINNGDKDYLYRGIIRDFFFDKNGNLDRVSLILASFRLLVRNDNAQASPTIPNEQKYIDIEGDYFILRYSDMRTMNIDYFFLEETGDEQEQDPPALVWPDVQD